MKRFFLFLMVCVLHSGYALSQNGAIIVALPDTINLGEIYLDELSDEHGKVQINVKNTGNQPLIIKSAKGCCGTNVKEWTKAPILPGKTGTVNVEFRTDPKPQIISRNVTIESNATNAKSLKVHITGIVVIRRSPNEIEL